MERKRIYAADDDQNLRDLLEVFLYEAGYEIHVFENGTNLLNAFTKEAADMVILDVMMPGMSGIDVCKRLRAISKVPIIMLTAKDSEKDYMTGIIFGGDVYITKPFKMSNLIMQIKAIFRRIEYDYIETPIHNVDKEVAYEDLIFDPKGYCVRCSSVDVSFSETELRLMLYMMNHSEQKIARYELLDAVWGIKTDVETRVVDETVRRIRKKLRIANSMVTIKTIWGYGYSLGVVEC